MKHTFQNLTLVVPWLVLGLLTWSLLFSIYVEHGISYQSYEFDFQVFAYHSAILVLHTLQHYWFIFVGAALLSIAIVFAVLIAPKKIIGIFLLVLSIALVVVNAHIKMQHQFPFRNIVSVNYLFLGKTTIWIIMISVVPIAIVRYFNRYLIDIHLKNTIIPGILTFAAVVILFVISAGGFIVDRYEHYYTDIQQIRPSLEEMTLREPAYLPKEVIPMREPKIHHPYYYKAFTFLYDCTTDGTVTISQTALSDIDKQIIEKKQEYIAEEIAFEEISLGNYDALYTQFRNDWSQLIWETTDSQISIENWQCLNKEELFNLALSL